VSEDGSTDTLLQLRLRVVPSWPPGALRCGEIATLRVTGFVGFSPSSAPLILAAIGGAIGGDRYLTDLRRLHLVDACFTPVVFSFQLGPHLVGQNVGLASFVGLIGGTDSGDPSGPLPIVARLSDDGFCNRHSGRHMSAELGRRCQVCSQKNCFTII
jgi:hypothetical protein